MTRHSVLAVLSPRIFREPSLLNTLLLFEQFMDGPEARKRCHTSDTRHDYISDKERHKAKNHSRHGKSPPTAFPEMVFRLDDNRVEQAYYEKGRKTYDNTGKIHYSKFNEIKIMIFPVFLIDKYPDTLFFQGFLTNFIDY